MIKCLMQAHIEWKFVEDQSVEDIGSSVLYSASPCLLLTFSHIPH